MSLPNPATAVDRYRLGLMSVPAAMTSHQSGTSQAARSVARETTTSAVSRQTSTPRLIGRFCCPRLNTSSPLSYHSRIAASMAQTSLPGSKRCVHDTCILPVIALRLRRKYAFAAFWPSARYRSRHSSHAAFRGSSALTSHVPPSLPSGHTATREIRVDVHPCRVRKWHDTSPSASTVQAQAAVNRFCGPAMPRNTFSTVSMVLRTISGEPAFLGSWASSNSTKSGRSTVPSGRIALNPLASPCAERQAIAPRLSGSVISLRELSTIAPVICSVSSHARLRSAVACVECSNGWQNSG